MTNLLASIVEFGGFTYVPATDTLIEVGNADGFAIAVPGTERIVGPAGISREEFAAAFADVVKAYGDVLANGAALGGWYSSDRGVYMVEVSEIHHVTREEAIALGVARNQEAIFDLRNGEEINTGGTGDGKIAA